MEFLGEVAELVDAMNTEMRRCLAPAVTKGVPTKTRRVGSSPAFSQYLHAIRGLSDEGTFRDDSGCGR